MSVTIQQLNEEDSSAPYKKTNKIRVKVVSKDERWISYTNSKQEDKAYKKFSMMDDTGVIIGKMYDAKYDDQLVPGKTVIIKNFIVRENELRLTQQTTVYGFVKEILTSKDKEKAAKKLLTETRTPSRTIKEVKEMPVRSTISVCGRIITDEMPKSLNTSRGQSIKRELTIQDKTGMLYITAWSKATEAPVKTGDYIQLKDVKTSYSAFYQQIFININNLDEIEIAEPNPEEETMNLVGLSDEGKKLALLFETADHDDLEMSIEKMKFLDGLKIKNMKEVKLPLKVKITYAGIDISKIHCC